MPAGKSKSPCEPRRKQTAYKPRAFGATDIDDPDPHSESSPQTLFLSLIAVLEGLQQLNQYQQNWILYRSTCESSKREKYLYLAKAGPYAGVSDARALLAERIESLGSEEEAKRVSAQEKPEEPAKKND